MVLGSQELSFHLFLDLRPPEPDVQGENTQPIVLIIVLMVPGNLGE